MFFLHKNSGSGSVSGFTWKAGSGSGFNASGSKALLPWIKFGTDIIKRMIDELQVVPLEWLQYYDERELELIICGMQERLSTPPTTLIVISCRVLDLYLIGSESFWRSTSRVCRSGSASYKKVCSNRHQNVPVSQYWLCILNDIAESNLRSFRIRLCNKTV